MRGICAEENAQRKKKKRKKKEWANKAVLYTRVKKVLICQSQMPLACATAAGESSVVAGLLLSRLRVEPFLGEIKRERETLVAIRSSFFFFLVLFLLSTRHSHARSWQYLSISFFLQLVSLCWLVPIQPTLDIRHLSSDMHATV